MFIRKWFELRSNIPRLKMIVWVAGILRKLLSTTDVSTTYAEAIFRVTFLTMASAQVVETSVATNSLSQDSSHSDEHFQSRYCEKLLEKLKRSRIYDISVPDITC